MKTVKFRLAAWTDPAGKRDETVDKKGNEDNMYVDSDLSDQELGNFVSDQEVVLSELGCLMVVADGMGGMNAGEVASQIAVETVQGFFAPGKIPASAAASTQSRERYMRRVIVEADAAIKKEAARNPERDGMGSTIILLWLFGNKATLCWCGDSRIYRFNQTQGLVQLSKDHSYVQMLVDRGDITPDQAFDHPQGNVITRSLGDPTQSAVADSLTVPIFKGDIFMVCSDGLSGVLRDKTMEEIIRANCASMQQCREALWEAAERADWYDNVTTILCEILDGDPAPAEPVPPIVPGVKTSTPLIHMTAKNLHVSISKKVLWCLLGVLSVGLLGGLYVLCMSKNPKCIETESVVVDTVQTTKKETNRVVTNLNAGTNKDSLNNVNSGQAKTAKAANVTPAATPGTQEQSLTPIGGSTVVPEPANETPEDKPATQK